VTADVDLAVVGGGPVGLATSIAAQLAGMSVAVVDARGGDGDKACGEGLMPTSLAALQRWGVDPPGHQVTGITYRQGSRAVTALFTHGEGRGVRRTALVAALRERAAALGIPTRHERITSLSQTSTQVAVGSLTARYVAVADGLHSPLRRSLSLEVASRRPARFGQRRHYAVRPWSDTVEVTWADEGEAYVTPVAEHEVGVALLGGRGAGFSQQLARFPRLVERLQGAQPTSRVRGAGPLRQTASARVAGRALLVGDAAGYVDALTGEGMAVGFASAEALVACLARGRPGDYEQAWRRVSRRPRLLTEGLLAATRSRPVRRALVPVAAAVPGVFSGAVNALA
jgi:flavin-dependent dehydrogenase